MQVVEDTAVYSASDLNNYLDCHYLSALELHAVHASLARPPRDPRSELIAAKGLAHERRYLDKLDRESSDVVRLPETTEPTLRAYREAEERTVAAIRTGASTIYQASFFDGGWFGRSDFLRRVERPSENFAWSYEVEDTKLALSERPYYIVQLCFYSEQLERILGTAPKYMHVILGSGVRRSYRVDEFSAYYRHLKRSFLDEMARLNDGNLATELTRVPYPVPHCETCLWSRQCAKKRSDADHLSLVARLTTNQAKLLTDAVPPILTMTALARSDEAQRPRRISRESFATIRRQARLQVDQRRTGIPTYEFLATSPERGFGLLPEPQVGDIFFDMEGDPLYEPGRGLEYLFGAYLPDENSFVAFWGIDEREERVAFEGFMDFVVARRKLFPQLHIYHYAPYEKQALRKLSGRHASRESEVDELLRQEVLVDLYAVVRQALCIGQPSYSIKKLEAFYGFERSAEIRSGDDSIVMFEEWLAHPEARDILNSIERYNEEDCRSTYYLREWLVARRQEAIAATNVAIPWRKQRELPTMDEERAATLARFSQLQQQLIAGVPEIEDRSHFNSLPDCQRARWLLAQLLSYHRREDKPHWWKIFDASEHSPTELIEDRECVGGLERCEPIAPFKRSPRDRNLVYTYTFPVQDLRITNGMLDHRTRKPVGEIVAVDEATRRLQIKRSIDPMEADTLQALLPSAPLKTESQRSALLRIALAYVEGSLEEEHHATVDLLLANPPRLRGIAKASSIQPKVTDAEHILPIIEALDESVLFLQGPPGSGKSTVASQVIAALLAAGNSIGVMSNSHRAIANLLHKIEAEVSDRGESFCGLYKSDGNGYDSKLARPFITAVGDNKAIEEGAFDLAAGTSWLFARERLTKRFDYLFIDEAGQIALANAIAVAPSAKNIVLLGDPLQLAQVSQGVHPAGSGSSVLEYLLEDSETISPTRGIFLDTSFRMHPSICNFISESVYAGRLRADVRTAGSRIKGPGLCGAGLRFLAVDHDGNSRESKEEANRIVAEIAELRKGSVRIANAAERPLVDDDILVVAPYNAQRSLIEEKLVAAGFPGVRVGTVDKFQGQEAPIVFYSMATSSIDDIPRSIDFLFEQNRFNVAISRAQCMSVLVASPALLDIRCSSVEQIAMVNILCAFLEGADFSAS